MASVYLVVGFDNQKRATSNDKPSMNTIDFFILAGLTVGLVIGLRAGLIKQVLSFGRSSILKETKAKRVQTVNLAL